MKLIVVIPTYNEKENIKGLIEAILSSDPGIHVLIVDDQSPDGTAEVVEGLAQRSSRIRLIKKTGRRGRGLADMEGMLLALQEGFDCIFQMDADGSHQPRYIPGFLDAIKKFDCVIGSRLIAGGAIEERSFVRNMITRLANIFIRCVLGLKTKDCTSGFRCYRAKMLAAIDLKGMISTGPSLLEEILYACQRRGFSMVEIPIVFIDRNKGKSKFNSRQFLDTLLTIIKIRLKR